MMGSTPATSKEAEQKRQQVKKQDTSLQKHRSHKKQAASAATRKLTSLMDMSLLDVTKSLTSTVVTAIQNPDSLIQSGCSGLYHATCSGSTTWYEFAREIFETSGLEVVLEPISTSDFGARAERPVRLVVCKAPFSQRAESQEQNSTVACLETRSQDSV